MNKVQSIKVRSIFVADRAWFDPVPVEWEKSVSENTFCFSEWSVEVQAPFELVLHHWSRANQFPKDIIYLTKSWVPATPRQYEERRMAKNDNEYKVAMEYIGMLLKSVVYFICFMLTWRSCYRVKYMKWSPFCWSTKEHVTPPVMILITDPEDTRDLLETNAQIMPSLPFIGSKEVLHVNAVWRYKNGS